MSKKQGRQTPEKINGDSRRQFLKRASVLSLTSGGSLTLASGSSVAAVKTKAKIVIVGSGLGGLAVANRLARELDGAQITIVDRKEIHNYQPGYTLVATGVWPEGKVVDRNSDFQPDGVKWIQEMAAEFDPVSKVVVTDAGQRIAYDFLLVATGLHLDFDKIEGMDTKYIGTHGLASVYPSAQAAQATWKAMDDFRQKGGDAVMTLPATPLKCAGAPLKMTFMLDSRLREQNTRSNSKIVFHSAATTVFGVPVINENVLQRWAKLGIQTQYQSQLSSIDIGGQKATFVDPGTGDKTEVPYDFIHVVPPMRAPDAIKSSPLSYQSGPMAAGGWLEVDRFSLQHTRFPNVFGIGDINGTPRGKTAATVKKSAPIVAQNMIDAIQGKALSADPFDGYTSCPLLLREGSAMLLEFDYAGKLTPSIPFIEPLQDSYFAWLMKYRFLKPAYIAVAKGRV
jgi:sulfide:quinone oxidoreductase